jgi:hypothetical protein
MVAVIQTLGLLVLRLEMSKLNSPRVEHGKGGGGGPVDEECSDLWGRR